MDQPPPDAFALRPVVLDTKHSIPRGSARGEDLPHHALTSSRGADPVHMHWSGHLVGATNPASPYASLQEHCAEIAGRFAGISMPAGEGASLLKPGDSSALLQCARKIQGKRFAALQNDVKDVDLFLSHVVFSRPGASHFTFSRAEEAGAKKQAPELSNGIPPSNPISAIVFCKAGFN